MLAYLLTQEGLAPAKEDISVADMLGRIHLPDKMEEDDMMSPNGKTSLSGRFTHL